MATTNPVLQVLTTAGNQSILAAGSRVTALANGQIGIFNLHSGLSVDGTVAGDCNDIFIAVGINRSTGGTDAAEDVQKSAGQVIQKRHMRAYTFRGYVPEMAKVVEVTGFKALADTAYGLKIEYRSQKSYAVNGYNQFAKTFNAQTSVSQTGDVEGNNGELASLLITNINADPDALVTASGFAYKIQSTIGDPTTDGTAVITVGVESFNVALLAADTATTAAAKVAAAINAVSTSAYAASSAAAVLQVYPKVAAKTGSTTATIVLVSAGGTGVTVGSITAANTSITAANIAAFAAANPSAGLGIRLTVNIPVRPNGNNDINVKYYGPGQDIIVTLPYGFEGIGTADVVTQLQMPEGKGYDLKQLEYLAGGWNGKPGVYRQSDTTGLAREGFEYFISPSANYHQFSLAYDQESVGGWEEYKNNLETIVAIPIADTTTLSSLVAVLDAIFTQFQPMANDTTADDTEQVETNTLVAATDGIESLS